MLKFKIDEKEIPVIKGYTIHTEPTDCKHCGCPHPCGCDISKSVIIDGKFVDKSEVTPEKHTFIGKFRYPYQHPGREYFICPSCGLKSAIASYRKCYDAGHLDVFQYQTMKRKKSSGNKRVSKTSTSNS